MKTAPPISKIKEWLRIQNPLELFSDSRFSISDIDPKPWSGHFNFLIKTSSENLVLRFKGPEWGEPTLGIIDEFKVLQKVQPHNVAPSALWLTKIFFGEPAMLEEYLEGELLNSLPLAHQEKILPQVARFIAKINSIPFRKSDMPFQEPLLSYEIHKKKWRQRMKIILANKKTRAWGKRVKEILPRAEQMLDNFEPLLKKALLNYPPAFIFISAHLGHCMKLKKGGLRFLNWEQVSYGDPSYTLAVFMGGLIFRKNFDDIKKKMVESYLATRPIKHFEQLLDQRLKEREVSNLLWTLWAYSQREDKTPVESATGVRERYSRVIEFL